MLWGGRFKEKLDEKALNFSSSLSIDERLIFEDIKGSIAHVTMLSSARIISKEESKIIIKGLKQIESLYKSGEWVIEKNKYEDIHSAIENKLTELVGVVAGKLHTGRSRNDQVLTALRLWLKKAITEIIKEISKFQIILLDIAENNTETIIPGYTHLQRAQIISLAYHMLSYVEMLERDKNRFSFCYNQTDINPLGAGALAGSTLPLDRNKTAELLGFNNVSLNALDTVADRDFLLDFLNAVAIGGMHLSRFAEEIILWSTYEWGFITLSDKFTTGSSLMPQKKNSDMAELIRGKCGRIYGNYLSLAVTLKGLPLSYNRDLQEDKEPVFDSYDTYINSLSIFSKMIKTARFNTNRFNFELNHSSIFATDLADYLVKKGIPFREAHTIIGNIVKFSEENGIAFYKISLPEFKGFCDKFDNDVYKLLEVEESLKNKITIGSPNPNMVIKEIKRFRDKINY
ncbi:MAG TPA: argininosuccinate lyase [Melioribacteraceae bacterium]|nr:argininosuccinate lyase [Melioribacteraceae bacterium]